MRFVGIDPSTKTGFVALDEQGNVLREKELTGIGKADPYRMATMIDEVMAHIKPDDFVVIEGFGFASQQAIQLGGIGWGLRMSMLRRGIKYEEASPSQLKKFASNKGNASKDELVQPIKDHWDFYHKSDNVRDAYVLARIAMCLLEARRGVLLALPSYQSEVIHAILNPKPKVKKKKKKAK